MRTLETVVLKYTTKDRIEYQYLTGYENANYKLTNCRTQNFNKIISLFLECTMSIREENMDMETVENYRELNCENISLDTNWNDSNEAELIMHTIHAYPAKFPAFIAKKALQYAENEGVKISTVADIFCGCGTVALESKVHNYDFWGCDINPVATMIAKVKSSDYEINKMQEYFRRISEYYFSCDLPPNAFEIANERLKYWYTENSYLSLLKIYQAILFEVDDMKYQEAFKCIFSAILKNTSKWLTKSIKPQIDPYKKEIDVFQRFKMQYNKFLRALDEATECSGTVDIQCDNFLELQNIPQVDLIVTSPPYVTSYEYADLHQLSSLWLQFTDDYRKLRKGSIGSIYNSDNFSVNVNELNIIGRETVQDLKNKQNQTAKVKSVARYFLDMQKTVQKCASLLNTNGMIFFVVGDTEYKGVKIQNAKHLIESMEESGFSDIKISKRTISKGICVPYRDENGKFSKDKSKKKVYHEEFIISGRIYK